MTSATIRSAAARQTLGEGSRGRLSVVALEVILVKIPILWLVVTTVLSAIGGLPTATAGELPSKQDAQDRRLRGSSR